MKKVFLLFLLLFAGCVKEVPVQVPIAQIIENNTLQNYLDATCRVRAGNSGGSGVCFSITNNNILVLTNRHVVGNNKNATVQFWYNGQPGKIYAGTVVKVAPIDMAVIMVKDVKQLPKAIPISNVAPKKSDVIYTVGHSNASWPKLLESKIDDFVTGGAYNTEQHNFIFNPKGIGGQSGSGVFKDGYIVGLLWGSKNNTTIAITCTDLLKYVNYQNLFITADWCNVCKDMLPIINKLNKEGYNIQIVDYKNYSTKMLPLFINKSNKQLFGVQTEKTLREFYNGKEKVDRGSDQKSRRSDKKS